MKPQLDNYWKLQAFTGFLHKSILQFWSLMLLWNPKYYIMIGKIFISCIVLKNEFSEGQYNSVDSCWLCFIRPFTYMVHVINQNQCNSCSDKGLMLETSAFSLFTVSNLKNQLDNTKLPCYTLPRMQHHNFFQNLPPLFLLCYLCYW